jgi:hypothetical protein
MRRERRYIAEIGCRWSFEEDFLEEWLNESTEEILLYAFSTMKQMGGDSLSRITTMHIVWRVPDVDGYLILRSQPFVNNFCGFERYTRDTFGICLDILRGS